jgi:deoxyribose-phosphate aldolase
MSTKAKVFEAQFCVDHGADEIDMVINIGWLKFGEYGLVKDEITKLKQAIGSRKLKVIIETCYLTAEEKKIASMLVVEGNADFVKTSTGFGSGGATFDDIELIKRVIKDKIQIKASGGIKDKKTAIRYLNIGVSRLGTSSGIEIVKETNP